MALRAPFIFPSFSSFVMKTSGSSSTGFASGNLFSAKYSDSVIADFFNIVSKVGVENLLRIKSSVDAWMLIVPGVQGAELHLYPVGYRKHYIKPFLTYRSSFEALFSDLFLFSIFQFYKNCGFLTWTWSI